MSERRFPIQSDIGPEGNRKEIPATTVPWSEAEIAYRTYAKLFGTEQSLETLAERGGFERDEFQVWRSGRDFDGKKVLNVPLLRACAENARLREALEKALTWEGRLNDAEQLGMQDRGVRECNEIKLAVAEEMKAARRAIRGEAAGHTEETGG